MQTYSNGDITRWIDLPQPGQPEPDHPAPELTLAKAGSVARATAVSAGPTSPRTRPDGTARTLAIAGLAAALLALAGAAWSLRRDRATGG